MIDGILPKTYLLGALLILGSIIYTKNRVTQGSDACTRLAGIPRKLCKCLPGAPGKDAVGQQGDPGRNCDLVILPNNQGMACSYDKEAVEREQSSTGPPRPTWQSTFLEICTYILIFLLSAWTSKLFYSETYGILFPALIIGGAMIFVLLSNFSWI